MIIAICGKMGSGKTFLMTLLGYFLGLEKVPCFANYSTTFAQEISSFKDLVSIENGIILFDEIHLNIDSRNWKNNMVITHWINQTRKKNLLLFYTTQHFKQVDVRLRKATDLIIWAFKKKGEKFFYVFIDPLTERVLKCFSINKKQALPFYRLYNSFEIVKPL